MDGSTARERSVAETVTTGSKGTSQIEVTFGVMARVDLLLVVMLGGWGVLSVMLMK